MSGRANTRKWKAHFFGVTGCAGSAHANIGGKVLTGRCRGSDLVDLIISAELGYGTMRFNSP